MFSHFDSEKVSGLSLSLLRTVALEAATNVEFLGNISTEVQPPTRWPASEQQKRRCSALPQSQSGDPCFNYVQTVQNFNETHLFLCGSMALEPKNALLNLKVGKFSFCICFS